MRNWLTLATEKLAGMGANTANKFSEIGETPFGMTKATKKEQRQQFQSLSAEDLQGMVNAYGVEAVANKIKRLMG